MDGQTYELAKQHLLSAYNLLAPTGVEQKKMLTMIREMEKEDFRERDEHILGSITAKIYDGLTFGNW